MNLEDDCPVCLGPKTPPIIRLGCGHLYCRDCIEGSWRAQWQQRIPATCPVCRDPIRRISFTHAPDIWEDVTEDEGPEVVEEEAEEPLIVEEVPPRRVEEPPPRVEPRRVVSIEDHYGRGRNIHYVVRWSDGSSTEETRAYMDTWPAVMAEYARRIRARNQRAYMERRGN